MERGGVSGGSPTSQCGWWDALGGNASSGDVGMVEEEEKEVVEKGEERNAKQDGARVRLGGRATKARAPSPWAKRPDPFACALKPLRRSRVAEFSLLSCSSLVAQRTRRRHGT